MEKKLTPEKIKEVFDDDESRKKILTIIELGQRERFLHIEASKLRTEIQKLETEIRAKHGLSLIASVLISVIVEKEEYKHFLEKYGQEVKKHENKM